MCKNGVKILPTASIPTVECAVVIGVTPPTSVKSLCDWPCLHRRLPMAPASVWPAAWETELLELRGKSEGGRKKDERAEGMPRSEAKAKTWQTGGYGGTTFAMLTSRFAFPAGPLRGASSALPSASVVSSDSCGA